MDQMMTWWSLKAYLIINFYTNYKFLNLNFSVLDLQPAASVASVSHNFEEAEQEELVDDFKGEEKILETVNGKEEGN